MAPRRGPNSRPHLSSPSLRTVLSPGHLRKVAKQCGGGPRRGRRGRGRGRRDVEGMGDGAGRPRAPGLPAPRLPSGPQAGAHSRPPSCPVREDGRFCLSIKALCCGHTKAAKPHFSSRPFGQIEGTQLNFQMALNARSVGAAKAEGEEQASRAHLPKPLPISKYSSGSGS